jgi:hypothetical protein
MSLLEVILAISSVPNPERSSRISLNGKLYHAEAPGAIDNLEQSSYC